MQFANDSLELIKSAKFKKGKKSVQVNRLTAQS